MKSHQIAAELNGSFVSLTKRDEFSNKAWVAVEDVEALRRELQDALDSVDHSEPEIDIEAYGTVIEQLDALLARAQETK